jgi:hypothetical protein
MELNMASAAAKPTTDLERIQQSYTSGAQSYVLGKEKASSPPTPSTRQEDQKASTPGLLCSLALQA